MDEDEWVDSLPPVQGFALSDDSIESESVHRDGTPSNFTQQLQIPRGPPQNWFPGAMIERVCVGMMVELSTIPLYLYAMYSVKPTPKGVQVRAALRAVLQQEMLHLALAGNLLSALGGSEFMDLYDPRVVPRYPGCILLDKIPMSLEALGAKNLRRFMRIESASDPRPILPIQADNPVINVAPEYKSIGDLYENLITGVRALPDENLANNQDNQFDGSNFFSDQLFVINDQATALRALRTIIEQGEGNLRVEHSHYDIFSKFSTEADSWEVYPVPNNPKTADYKNEEYIYKTSLAFDAAYCYLLQTIQRVWRTSENSVRRVLFRNIHSIMNSVLTPLAEILVQQDRTGNSVAAPCFNYYPTISPAGATEPTPSPVVLPPIELHKQLSNRMEDAANAAPYEPTLQHPPVPSQQRLTLERINRYIGESIKPSG